MQLPIKLTHFKTENNISNNAGQSLVEAVVATALVTLVLIGLVSAITYSMGNAQYARNKAQATKYAQEAVEWLRIQRDASWTVFYGGSSGNVACLSTLTWPPASIPPTCNPISGDNYDFFTRTVQLTRLSTDKIKVAVEISWPQGSRSPKVQLDTFLTRW